MIGWEEYKLKEIGRFVNGANFTPVQLGTGNKFVNLLDIYRSSILYSSDKFDLVDLVKPDSYYLENGDILFVRSSVKPDGIGYPCLFIKNTDEDVVFCGFIIRYRFNREIVYPLFLLYLLLSEEYRNKVIARGQVLANTNINQRGLGSITLSIPKSLLDQRAIAGILSKVDDAIEAVEQSISAAERLKKTLMQNLFTGKLKPDGTWRTEDEFYIDVKFGKVPKGWDIRRVKKIIALRNGKGNTTENLRSIADEIYNVPVYGGNGITGYFHSALLEKETLVIGRVGEYCGNVFKTPERCWVTDNAMLVKEFLIQNYSLDFFKYQFNRLNFKHYSDSTGQPKITQGGIGALRIIYPRDRNEQTTVASKISSIQDLIDILQTD